MRDKGGTQRSRAGLASSVSAVQLGRSGTGGDAEAEASLADANLQTSASLPTLHASTAPTQREPAKGVRAARRQASVGKASGKPSGKPSASKAPMSKASMSKASVRTATLGASASAPLAAAPHAAAPTLQTLPLASRGLSRADLRTWESRDHMLAAKSYHNEWTVLHPRAPPDTPLQPRTPLTPPCVPSHTLTHPHTPLHTLTPLASSSRAHGAPLGAPPRAATPP